MDIYIVYIDYQYDHVVDPIAVFDTYDKAKKYLESVVESFQKDGYTFEDDLVKDIYDQAVGIVFWMPYMAKTTTIRLTSEDGDVDVTIQKSEMK